jgi:hypothetical protein
VIVSPPYALSLACIKILSQTFAVNEAESIEDFNLPQSSSTKHQLLLVQSLQGIVAALTAYDMTLFVHKSNK